MFIHVFSITIRQINTLKKIKIGYLRMNVEKKEIKKITNGKKAS